LDFFTYPPKLLFLCPSSHRVYRQGCRFGGRGGQSGFCIISYRAPIGQSDTSSATSASYQPLPQGHHAFAFLWA